MSDVYGMEDALLEVESECALTYTFNGQDYPCSRGDTTSTESLGMGGYAPQADLVIVARKSAMPSPTPALKAAIVVGGRTYLLDQITEDPNGVFQVWSLSDPNKAT